ncbi:uncharacterized protein [Clytia hemisphaerica]|uniref:Rho GTPase n=1 Tax=Clytia hemisphaerica TaxID=252671 RepID=A0A7M5XBM5_9CNID
MAESTAEAKEEDEKNIDSLKGKFVIFGGDGSAGKTTMFHYYYKGEIHPNYTPVKYECSLGYKVYTYKKSGKKILIAYDDHEGGGEDWKLCNHYGYELADVVVLCYTIGWRYSFEEIENYWHSFVQKYAPKAAIILCATKIDLRNDQEFIKQLKNEQNDKLVTTLEGKQLADKIGALGFYECSTYNEEGVKEVFEAAAEATMYGKSLHSNKSKCLIL